MHVTLVELEFVELPDLPITEATVNNGYLLSMWDCSCRMATWNAAAERFEDVGGLLNPLDVACWGDAIIRAVLAKHTSRPDAGWLEPKYDC
ncbi:hypothetical protein WL29_20980 [Burkholderia ubonensis]|uniref:Uncharacterized protein n=1 Tax=Burkholderia ubonensis TaxID=101571 RepID=A0A106QCS3_9BURK|nr:hypothetical protein [Burkholderia ubonensis]KWA83842.1 hypothetical protein WL29_20980 [Burkholderia ubonensis]